MPVIVLAPKDELFDKTVSNMQEVMARGGKVLLDHRLLKGQQKLKKAHGKQLLCLEATNDLAPISICHSSTVIGISYRCI